MNEWFIDKLKSKQSFLETRILEKKLFKKGNYNTLLGSAVNKIGIVIMM